MLDIRRLQEIRIGFGNGLAPIWRQTISQSNDDSDLCCMDAACEENELTQRTMASNVHAGTVT